MGMRHLFFITLLFLLSALSQQRELAESPLLGGTDFLYHKLIGSTCADLKDDLNKCCADFETCRISNGFNCVENHEECNANVISGRDRECSALADSFVHKNERYLADEDWKCYSNLLGAVDAHYREVMHSSCAYLKDKLSQCCADFNSCDSSKGDLCISKHEKCNSLILPKGDNKCVLAANKLVQRDKHETMPQDYFDNWQCSKFGSLKSIKQPNIGGDESRYRSLFLSTCYDLKDKLSQCCDDFITCMVNKEGLCTTKHERCNSFAVSKRETECAKVADANVVKGLHETLPEDYFNNWKCKSMRSTVGGDEYSYRNLFLSSCYDLKDKLSECCAGYINCRNGNGNQCVFQHKKCNAAAISGRAQECSTVAEVFINHDTVPAIEINKTAIEINKQPTRTIIYLQVFIVYARGELGGHPVRFCIIITLIILSIVFLVCGIACLCCASIGKRREKKSHHKSSSRGSFSVRSNSAKD